MNEYMLVLQKYAVFNGRSARREYWMFVLANFIVQTVIVVPLLILKFAAHIDLLFVANLYSLAVFCPALALTVRRLHDIDKSGWWALIGLVPLVGAIVLLVFACQDSTAGDNQFGPNPKAITTAA